MKISNLILIFLLFLPNSISSQEEKVEAINFSLGWNVGDCWIVGVYGFNENGKKFSDSDYQRVFTSTVEISVNDKWIEEDTIYQIEFIGNYQAFMPLLIRIDRDEKPKDGLYSFEYTLNINAEHKKAKDGKIYRIDKDGRKYLRNIRNSYIGDVYQYHGRGLFEGLPILIFPHFDKDHLYYHRSVLVDNIEEADWSASYVPKNDTTIFHFQRREGPSYGDFFDDTKQYWAKGAKFWSRYVWNTHNIMNGRKIEFPALEAVLLAEHLAD